ncbi:MAG: PEGA domain-containing protein, partial [Myxococcales bacterium]
FSPLVLLTGLAISTPSFAQPRPTPPAPQVDAAAGKRHFDVGMKLYREKAFEGALVEFQESYRLGRRHSALKNVAQCQRELKRFAAAYGSFELLLKEHDAVLKPKEKTEIQRVLADLALVTGTLEVRTTEADAVVFLDGIRVGTTPLAAPLRVDLGSHKIRLEKPARIPFEADIVVAGQQAAVVEPKLAPEVKTGKLEVREKTGQAIKVVVDGEERGPAPWSGELLPGRHEVEGRGDKIVAPKQAVDVVLGKATEIVLVAAVPTESVTVRSGIPEAQISVDGALVGTGTYEGKLAIGTHRLRITAPGFATHDAALEVVEGRSVMMDIPLKASVPAKREEDPDDAFRGFFFRWDLAFNVQTASENYFTTCSNVGVKCDTPNPLGGAMTFHFGHNFNWVGIDVALAFGGLAIERKLTDTKSVSVTGVSPSSFVGIGPRFLSPGSIVRFTASADLGLAIRSVVLKTDQGANWAVYGSPGLLLDAGILLGSTPGAKFSLGIMSLIEFAGGASAWAGKMDDPLGSRPAQMATQTSVLIGPFLGIQTGH